MLLSSLLSSCHCGVLTFCPCITALSKSLLCNKCAHAYNNAVMCAAESAKVILRGHALMMADQSVAEMEGDPLVLVETPVSNIAEVRARDRLAYTTLLAVRI